MPNHPPWGLGIGLALMGIVAALAVFAGVVAPIDPFRTGAIPLQPPSSHHLLGTDELGRDLWSNIAYGARVSLLVGGLAALLSTVTGVAAGVAAGYYGRAVDEGLMRFAEVFQIIPAMLVALLLVAFFGGRLWTLIPVIALAGWPLTARIVRSEVLSLREREFVLGARALGGRDAHIIWRHLIPNAFPPVLIGLPLQVGRAILLEAGLSFLGLGDPGAASWGKLLQSAQEYMREAWWLAVFPGLALTVTVLALYLVAEELHVRTAPVLTSGRRGPFERAHESVGPASPAAPEAGLT
jgi:peptide/nickel transport system permease protein